MFCKQGVTGSSPVTSTKFASKMQVLEISRPTNGVSFYPGFTVRRSFYRQAGTSLQSWFWYDSSP